MTTDLITVPNALCPFCGGTRCEPHASCAPDDSDNEESWFCGEDLSFRKRSLRAAIQTCEAAGYEVRKKRRFVDCGCGCGEGCLRGHYYEEASDD